ncbi:MAG: lytic transglycosylase domain-containing protein [Elusimicrobia bacterium]|nr:lytic transglycosylase domain-containing protein [Elusimicrobiota bacterium]
MIIGAGLLAAMPFMQFALGLGIIPGLSNSAQDYYGKHSLTVMTGSIRPFQGQEAMQWAGSFSRVSDFYNHDFWIWKTAVDNELDPNLWKAVIMVESAGKADSVSRAGAMGLAQLMPDTARAFGLRREKFYDPQANLRAGARYFKWLLEYFGGNVGLALAAYNAGPKAVLDRGGIPNFGETKKFVASVYTLYHWLQDHPEGWAMAQMAGAGLHSPQVFPVIELFTLGS